MKTNFAYIDDVMDRALTTEYETPNVPTKDCEAANKSAKKLIGGFRVHDQKAENAALDNLIAKRREAIELFRKDRKAIREALAVNGVTPLAVCPTGAWYKICKDAGLFILTPDASNQIRVSRNAFSQWTGKSAEKNIDAFAQAKWPEMLKLMMPDNCSLREGIRATLQLPDPPADIADILCKAQGFPLTVAAVPEAIRLAEKPSELLRTATSNPKDLWAQEQGYDDYADWLKRDPIIFTEHGTATAVIAQFGEFPIEQEIVDRAVKADSLLEEKPNPVREIQETTLFFRDMYLHSMRGLQNAFLPYGGAAEEEGRRQREAEMNALRAVTQRRTVVNASDWTGLR